jgi:protoporphyrinogen oxidase
LACADELERLGHDDWVLLEASDRVGGLAASVRDTAGFTWDLGGHVVFSHFGEFDRVVEQVMPEQDLWRHERASFIRLAERWVPYPFQQHLRHLPGQVAAECLIGLVEAQMRAPGGSEPVTFLDWLVANYGDGLTRWYFAPYNQKVWTVRPDEMNAVWVSDRVATCDWRSMIRHALAGDEPPAWGPNSSFAFPKEGGTGAIWQRLAAGLSDRIRLNAPVVKIDADGGCVYAANGHMFHYRNIVSTMPLDVLVSTVVAPPAECLEAVRELQYNSVYIVGLGYNAPLRATASWLYFPEPEVPFYRTTNFAKYAAANVPHADTTRYSSWMSEIAVPAGTRLDEPTLVGRVDDALRRLELVPADAARVSAHVEYIERAYPLPTLGRDQAMRTIQAWLSERGIRSRGRFGTWMYEHGNMDHAVKMGIDAARSITGAGPEELIEAVLTRARAAL